MSISLTKLETVVMKAVWEAEPEPVRVRDVVETVNARRPKTLAYTTVQTILTILRDKGVVERVEGVGRAHRFKAIVSRSEASRHMVGELVERLFGGRVQPLLQQLIDETPLEATELAQLREWVDARLRDAEGEDE